MPLTKITKQLTIDGSLAADKLADSVVQTSMLASDAQLPRISTIQVTDSSWTVLDDTAVDTAGGYIELSGTNFVSGCSTVIGTTNATSTTFVSSTVLRVQVPAISAGTYDIYVVNPDGGTAVKINGLTTSAFPAWSTASSLPDQASGVAISINLAATGDNIVYTLAPGSSLPAGLTLSSAGLLSGTVTVENSTLYNFSVRATDAQNQNTDRAFSMYVLVITSTFAVTDSSWTVLDDTAVDTAGGYFVITDSVGVESGATVTIGGTSATSVTYVDSSTLRVQMPAKAAGTYTVFVFNPGGSVRNGFLTFATTPAWTTNTWLTNVLPDVAFTRTVAATGATTYSLASGSSLPSGVSLASNGDITGTITGVTATTTYSFTIDAVNTYNQSASRTFNLLLEGTIANGQQAYTTAGTYTWTCPANVYKVSAVAVGGGGGGYRPASGTGVNGSGGGGGGLGWKNNISVIPGQTYTVTVGVQGPFNTTTIMSNKGGDSWFVSTSTVRGIGGGSGAPGSTGIDGLQGLGGSYVGDGGGAGGNAGTGNATQRNGGGGGGAGGYSGTGGQGGFANSTAINVEGKAGAGGAGGGGGCPRLPANSGQTDRGGGGGGGVGLLGQGASGAASGTFLTQAPGKGGSGGADSQYVSGYDGGVYGGGGGGGGGTSGQTEATLGGVGAVRIIWGTGRSFPATNTGNL